MATTETEASTVRAGWLGSIWRIIATAFAVIGLVDFARQSIVEWPTGVHRFATQYAIERDWLFGQLPFSVPPEWRDFILLFVILFIVMNVVFYERNRRVFTLSKEAYADYFALWVSATTGIALWLWMHSGLWEPHLSDLFSAIGGLFIVSAAFFAWRWFLTTAAIFGALVVINYAYFQWLAPLVEHH
jgi:hypothetical protein